MTKVYAEDLGYLEAKLSRNQHKWTAEEDQILRDYNGVDPAMILTLLHIESGTVRVIMGRQRQLGLREFSGRKSRAK